MPRFRAVATTVVTLLFTSAAWAWASSPNYTGRSIDTLVDAAASIVLGDVAAAPENIEELALDGVRSPVLVRRIQLMETETLKGSQRSVIAEYAPLSLPVKIGKRYLWFLGEPTALGLDPVLGNAAGQFRIVSDSKYPGLLFAMSQVNNRGLWDNSATGRLWKDEAERSQVEKKLTQLGVDKRYHSLILSYGDDPCRPRPVPLDLIRAYASARIDAAIARTARRD